DEVELDLQVVAVHAGVVGELHQVVTGVGVPAPARAPLGQAAARATADLMDGRVHVGLLVEVADHAGCLDRSEPLPDEVVEGDLLVRPDYSVGRLGRLCG